LARNVQAWSLRLRKYPGRYPGDHLQHHLHSRVGGKERTSPSSALQGEEGADQYTDTRTIEIADAGKIDRDIDWTPSHKLLHLLAKGIFCGAEFQGPFEVENRDTTRAANVDLQISLSLPAEINGSAIL
jgi:hypothetical protein